MGATLGLGGLTAFVPMRHDSDRVPGKNYRMFHGRPLFHHILDALQGVPEILRIVVDTDSSVIRQSCAEAFPEVVCVERLEHLRGGMVPMTEVLARDAELFPSDWYLQTHSTNPLLQPDSISSAIRRLQGSLDRHDSLVSVTRHRSRFFRHDGRPLNHDPSVLRRTQDLDAIDEENSCLYLFTADQIRSGMRFGRRPLLYPLQRLQSIDIDTEEDFLLAESAYSALRGVT